MARILPDVSGGFGPIVPQRQRFMTKVQSDEDKALKIIKAIGGGVQIASDLYGLGSGIYDKYIKETAAEAKARLQREMGDPEARQNVARSMLGGGMVGDQYDPMLGSRVPEFPLQPTPTQSGFAQARGEFAQDFADVGALGEADKAVPKLSQLPPTESQMAEAQQQAAAPAPATTGLNESEVIGDLGKLGRLLPQYAAQRGMNVDEVRKMVATGDWQGLGPGSTETCGRYLDRMQESGRFGAPAPPAAAPAALEPGRVREDLVIDNFQNALAKVAGLQDPELEKAFVEKAASVAEERGMPRAAAEFRAALQGSGGPEASAFDFIESRSRGSLLDKPRTAAEFARDFEAGQDFAVGDLNMAYRALWNAGRQQEAEELVGLARGAMDIGQFVVSGNEPKALIVARARQAIRKGADVGGVTGTQAVKLATSAAKRRKRRTPSSKTPRHGKRPNKNDPLTDAELANRSFMIYAARNGIEPARGILYSGKPSAARANQNTLDTRSAKIEDGLTPGQAKKLSVKSGGNVIQVSNRYPDIGKSRTTATIEKTERDEAEKTEKGRRSKLSKLIRTPIAKLSKATVASYVNKNEPVSKMTLKEFVRSKYQASGDTEAVIAWDEIKEDYGLTRAAIQKELNQIKTDFVEASNLAAELGLSSE